MTPNFDDMSGEMVFGQMPEPIEEDPAFKQPSYEPICWSSNIEQKCSEEYCEESAQIGRTLRSTIVCVLPDLQSPSHNSSQSSPSKYLDCYSDEDTNKNNHRSKQPSTSRHMMSHLRKVEIDQNSIKIFKDSELDQGLSLCKEKKTIKFSHSSKKKSNDLLVRKVKDSYRDMTTQQDYPYKYCVRGENISQKIFQRENEILSDEEHIRNQDRKRFDDDTKGKEKQITTKMVLTSRYYRKKTWQKEYGSHYQNDRGQNVPYLHKDKYNSKSYDKTIIHSPKLSDKYFRGEKVKEIKRRKEKDQDKEDALLPELYSIHKATIHSIRPFGLFVKIDGYRKHGLIHVSQVSDHEVTKRDDADVVKVEALSSIVAKGESVWVKVISVKTEENGIVKVGCSLKYVFQRDGRDLDPNNLQLKKLQTKSTWQASKKLQLEANYNVTCSQSGDHGHLNKECYSISEKSYDLLPSEDNDHSDNDSYKDKRVVTSGVLVDNYLKSPNGPLGRGRAMVQPAWMKHGVGVCSNTNKVLDRKTLIDIHDFHKDEPSLPEKVTTTQEAMTIIAKLKHHKRDKKRKQKYHIRSNIHSNNDNKRDKQTKRYSSNEDYKSRKKHKV